MLRVFRWFMRKLLRRTPREGQLPSLADLMAFPLPADVVVSYSRKDSAVAEPLIADLRARGINVWWDRELYSGEDLHDAIAAALEAAKAVIVIWSDAAATSMWVRDEARRAARKSKLITTHVAGFDLEKIPLGFGERHCASVEDRAQLIRALGRFNVQPLGPSGSVGSPQPAPV